MNVQSRGIRSVRDVSYQEHSPTHKVGLVVEPGKWQEYDPFLLMAEDFFQRGTFGMHPHRGIETVTYVIDGKLEHMDNKTGGGVLLPGDVQWMTAGKGIIHTEDPAVGETVHSLQLWVNLPSDKKLTEPRYQNMRAQDMPVRYEEGATIRVFSGSSKGVEADTKNHVPVTMVEFILEPGAAVTQDLPGGYNGFLYILEGKGTFGRENTMGEKGQVLWLERGNDAEMSEVKIHANEKLHVLLYAGQPIGEKVVARGPFVMNSEEEIAQAYKDFREGKFE
ncbi:pirin family protein [Siminovitchia acidinfaciens]|uniref:Pirin family protein n=1 Tax=Siminovitchia acidinfaciens TaxID=2321395 RepID=A0A429Y8M2_9BACI|nr:pirin family protein [Siminovitchia acidinfaciens]RST77750.1 pirin family protein [Siminovitchia acidinfaciens]